MHIKKHLTHLTVASILLGAHAILIFIVDYKIKLTTFSELFLSSSIYLPLIAVKELGFSSKSGFGIGVIDWIIIAAIWFFIYLLCVMAISKIISKFKNNKIHN